MSQGDDQYRDGEQTRGDEYAYFDPFRASEPAFPAQYESPFDDTPPVAPPPAPEPQIEEPQTLGPQTLGPWPPTSRATGEASANDLSTSRLLGPVRDVPTNSWRRALYTVSGGRINVGNSVKEQRRIALTKQVDKPLHGSSKIAVLSLKGGVGKTTIAATLGSTFASIRGDRVIAVDANPDRGTLSQKLRLETDATVRTLLRDERTLDKYSDVRRYTSQNPHRLEVLASESDPAALEEYSASDYAATVALLERFYSIILTDCGTGMLNSAMQGILHGSDSLVVVSTGSVDGARSASATLDYLDAHGYRSLVEQCIVVVNQVRPQPKSVDLARIIEHFEQRCRAVRVIPFDPHLEAGAEIDLLRLKPKTRSALLEVAAAVSSAFS